MSSSTNESTPLIQGQAKPLGTSSKPSRTVTFNTNVSTDNNASNAAASRSGTSAAANSQGQGQPMLASLNNKLRRRHSSGAPLVQQLPTVPKAGAQRTTKHAQKLKLLPNPDHGEEGPDEESGRDVYAQYTRISDPIARRDAARLGKDDRERLPRVTAYCTANAYKLEEMMKFFRGRGRNRGAQPKQFDECIYTPYTYSKDPDYLKDRLDGQMESHAVRHTQERERRHSDSALEMNEDSTGTEVEDSLERQPPQSEVALEDGGTLIEHPNPMERRSSNGLDSLDFDTRVHIPEVFLFEYGTVVIWGMTLKEEERFLRDIAKFETEKLSKDDVQAENFNFYYTREYQARIYNDFISLRDKRNYMTKLAISHALSQSVKTSLYEELVDNTIDTTKEVPSQIATTGKINLSRKEINMQVGELFILRINIHLQGSVLDSPELMWAEPQLDPVYQAVRSYLEMDQRVSLLNERLDVISDLLAVLKDQLTQVHGEGLEWIVIVLIAAEILVAAINIVVDLYAGAD